MLIAAFARSSLVFVVLAACQLEQAPAAGQQGPELGTFGVDLSGMDRSVAPGDDFYRFVNGGWEARTEIPADRSRFTSFGVRDDLAKARSKAIVDAVVAVSGATGDRKKIADCYRAYMDEAAIEAKGLAPLQPVLASIRAIADRRALATALGQTLRCDVDLLNATNWHTDRLFGLWVSQHLARPEVCAPYLVQGGLTLPDRDYYLDASMADLRKAFAAHVAAVLGLAHVDDAANKAAAIVTLETAIARVHATGEDTNDVKKGANYWRRGDFAQQAPGLDWDAWFAA